jgi:hypothetical protein
MIYIEEKSLHALLLNKMSDNNYINPNQQKSHLKYTDMGDLHEDATYSRIRPIPLEISLTHSVIIGISEK